MYFTLIFSSIGSSDVNKYLLLPELFWRHLLPPNFWSWRHTKVDIHSVSLSLPVSPLRQQPCLKLKQQSNGCPMR
jgi:hypothetical protein